MSDTDTAARIAELEAEVERLTLHLSVIDAQSARIAELEAERDDKHRMLHEALDRIAELEAERNHWHQSTLQESLHIDAREGRAAAVLAEREAIKALVVARRSPHANINECWTVDAILADIRARSAP